MPPEIASKLWYFSLGVFGSLAIELVKILKTYQTGKPLPDEYRLKGYWATRIGLALTGGFMAVIYDVHTNILAVHIGLATPAILENLAKNPPGPARQTRSRS